MRLIDRVLNDLDNRRDKILNGGINCILSPFRRFRRSLGDFCNSSLYLLKEELGSQIDIGFP